MSDDILAEINEAFEEESTDKINIEENDEVVDEAAEEVSEEEVNDEDTDESKSEKKDESEEDESEKPKPKKNRLQERFNKLTEEKYKLRAELEEYKAKFGAKSDEPVKPDPRMFKTERDFRDAVIGYQKDMEHYTEKKEEASQVKIQQEQSAFNAKMSKEKALYKDYDIVVSNISHLPITEELHDALVNGDSGTDLLYFLGKNPTIAEGIVEMSGAKAARTLAVIAEKLKASKSKGKKVVSDAPAPVTKVKGNSGSVVKSVGKMSGDEYIAWRKSQATKNNKK